VACRWTNGWEPLMIPNGTPETSVVRVVFASDGEKPQRMRGTVTAQPSRLRIGLVIKKRGWICEHTIEFRLYHGKPFFLPFSAWLAASLDRSLPVIPDNIKTRMVRPTRWRLSIDPPSPLDFTLHIYGAETFIRSTVMTFAAAPA
jgi:hypothetical protein